MMRISLKPDDHIRWIYDRRHPDYNSERAKHLRASRERALASCPAWLLDEAWHNDESHEVQS